MAETISEKNLPESSSAVNENATQSNNNSNTIGAGTQLSPLVYWAQTEQQITLKVDLKDAKEAQVDFATKSINFGAKGYGARGMNAYKFTLNFYANVNEKECSYRIHDNKIELVIVKSEMNWWPRLVATPQKPHWLKIDFDRWRSEEDLVEEKPRDVMEDYSKEYDRLQKQEFGYIKENTKKVYMVFYNLAMFIGYLYILCVLCILYSRDGYIAVIKAYESVGTVMKLLQLLQYMEVLHPLFGYTKGGALMPFFQVTGRNFVLFVMIEMEARMQIKPVVFYVFVIWSLVEIVRYPYYLTQLLDIEVDLLTWLRYTIWIPLYPMGILCEGVIILRNIEYFKETQRLSLSLPNKWNVTFDMPLFMYVYLALLILPGTYIVMTHMAKVRAKKLGGSSSRRSKRD